MRLFRTTDPRKATVCHLWQLPRVSLTRMGTVVLKLSALGWSVGLKCSCELCSAIALKCSGRQWEALMWSVLTRVCNRMRVNFMLHSHPDEQTFGNFLGIDVHKVSSMFWYAKCNLLRDFFLAGIRSSYLQRKLMCPIKIPMLLLTISHSQKGCSNNRHQVYCFQLVKGK